MNIREGLKHRVQAYRNPIYLLYGFGGLAIFIFGASVAGSGVGPVEISIFRSFNHLSDSIYPFMVFFSFFGSLAAVPLVAAIALFRKHYANSIKILLAGFAAYALAVWMKMLDIRPRPEQIIENATVREASDALLGYPSGHMAVAAVLALTSYLYLPKRFHRYITILAIAVAVSRMYLGVHFPMDLVGGWGIGLFVGGVFNFAFGSRRYDPVDPIVVKNKLNEQYLNVSSVRIASVDARGSIPYIAKSDKNNLFVKIVGIENNVADWLFKLVRKAIYRRLEDEQPFLSPKRQLEHEAYVAMLAKQSGVNTPNIVSIFEAEKDRWAMAQEMIDGASLDKVDKKRISDKVLVAIWREVEKLHQHNIIHRDLRAANVFLDSNNTPWIIDFGFSEASTHKDNFYRDNVELIASLSLLVGIKQSVKIAHSVIGDKAIKESLPFMSYASLSGATTGSLKKQKGSLKEIRQQMAKIANVKTVKLAKQKRLDKKMLLILVSLGIAIHALLPQIASFDESVNSAKEASPPYLFIGLLFSVVTYILAGATYKFISIYPVKFWPSVIVQVASSFASKVAPAGTGGMALNARFLYKNDHDAIQSGAVTVANTLLGLVGHVSVVLIVAIFTGDSIRDLVPEIHITRFMILVAILGFLTVLLTFRIYPKFRKLATKSRDKLFEQLSFYRDNTSKFFFGYLTSVGITLSYASILYFSALALGVDFAILDVVYVFTVGAIVATVTPTPGGLGGAEAALIASMTSLGVTNGDAIAITLIYRLLTFWLPIIPGFFAFRYATKNEII